MNKDKITLVAVYGTLRQNQSNNCHLAGAEYIGEYDTEPIYTMYSLHSFPGIVENGNTSIKMEVFEVQEEDTFKRLDNLEGFYGDNNKDNLYNKKIIETPFGKAFVYFYNGDVRKRPAVEGGDWVDYKRTLGNAIKNLTHEDTYC